MHAVEVVTSSESVASVRRLVGRLDGVQVVSAPSRPRSRKLIVASMHDLAARREPLLQLVEDLREEAAPVVVLRVGGARGRVAEPGRVAGELAILGSIAPEPLYFAPDSAAFRRLLIARRAGAEDRLIASAELRGDTLLVWSCEPRLFRCPTMLLSGVARMDPTDRADFVVSESGSRLHWPAGDVDLDLEAIVAALDPRVREAQIRAQRASASRLGGAIRRFREERGLRQTDVSGVSDRELRRIEGGDVMPHAKTLQRLAAAHGLEVNEYLQAVVERQRRT